MALIEGLIRRFQPIRGGQGHADVRMTHLESVAVGQTEPARFEMSRAGRRFGLGNNAAITGIANATALPTTAAQWAIYNADPSKSLVFEEIGMYLTSGTPGVGGVLLGTIYQTPAVTGASRTGTSIASLSGGGGFSSKAIVTVSQTITTPSAPTWQFLAANSSPNVTAFPASTYLENRDLQGAIVVPPGWALGLAVVAPAGTTPLFAPFATWVEVETDLE